MGVRLRLAVGVSAAVAAALLPTTSHAYANDTSSGDLDPTAKCTELPVERQVALLPDGTEIPAKLGDGLGRRLYYKLDGGTVTEVIPPVGFIPLQATLDALDTYGIPPRPEDPAELLNWINTWKTWHRTDTAGMCQTDLSNVLFETTFTNWAGGWSTLGSTKFTKGSASWAQTGFDSYCSSASGYSTWHGLGGTPAGGGKLLQTGTSASPSSLNGTVMWWEALRPGYDTHQVNFANSTVAGGDVDRRPG